MRPPGDALDFLIVEDEPLLVLDLETIIKDMGHTVSADAATLDDVRALPAGVRPDIAFVDVHLADGSSGLDVCAHLLSRWPGVCVVFVTANANMVPDDFAGAHGIIPKPFSRNGLARALTYIVEGYSDPPPKSRRPDSFKPSPRVAAVWAR